MTKATDLPLQRVTLNLKPAHYTRVRFAFSPLWECIAAFRAWKDPSGHSLLLPWLNRVSPALSGIDWRPLAALAIVPRGMIPDFVTPPPPTAVPKFSDELENLCKVPEAVLRAEIEIAYPRGVPPELKSLLREPSALLNEIAFLLNEFWHRAIAPDWQRLHCFLESEVLFRARAMALGGLDAVFQGLHRCVIYRDGCLSVQTVSYWDGKRRKPGILLVPSIFGWPDAFLTVRPPWQPTVVYPARGIADLWTPNELPYSARLRRVLGSSRAKILARLQEPQTTKQISASLNISPPSVSEQIMNLRLAGILDRTRIGRNVFYSVNEKGKGLLAAFHV